MPVLLSDIPGLTEAVAKAAAEENELRASAWLSVTTELCRIEVRQFTLRHFMLLDAAGSPFIVGGTIGRENIIQFLHVVSTAYVWPGTRALAARAAEVRLAFTTAAARTIKISRNAKHPLRPLIAEIDAYLESALFDRWAASRGERPAFHFVAGFVDALAAEYGWPAEVFDTNGQPIPGAGILDMPLARLMQLDRAAALRRNPKATLTNRLSDEAENKAITAYLDSQKKKPRVKCDHCGAVLGKGMKDGWMVGGKMTCSKCAKRRKRK